MLAQRLWEELRDSSGRRASMMNTNMSISLTCVWRQLQEEVDVLADRMEQADNSLKGDWARWQHSMTSDLRSAFISAAEKNVDYYEKVRSLDTFHLTGLWFVSLCAVQVSVRAAVVVEVCAQQLRLHDTLTVLMTDVMCC